MWLLWYPILTPPKTTVHIEDRATSQFEAQTDAPTLDSVEFLNPVNGKLI